MININYRPLSSFKPEEDLSPVWDGICQINAQTFSGTTEGTRDCWTSDNAFINRRYFHRNNDQFIIAFKSGNPVGYVIIRDGREQGSGYLSYIAVTLRKQGIGAELMRRALKTRSYRKVTLDFEGGDKGLHTFYQKTGKSAGYSVKCQDTGRTFKNGEPKSQIIYTTP